MPYQNHIKSIYGPYMSQGPPPMLQLRLCHIKPISNPYMGHIWVTPSSKNWTLDFEPAFSQWFYFPLSPRSIFHTSQRFPIQNHVTSGSHEPAIPFSTWSAVFPPEMTYDVTGSSSGHVIALDQSEARNRSI